MKSVDTTETADWLKVFENLFNASCGVFEDGRISVWDYANPNHFNALWKSLGDASLKVASRVLINWSKTPSDESLFPVNTSEHVSPLHWAACAAKEVQIGQPPTQIAILDLNPAGHQSEYLHTFCRGLDRHRLRWLRLLQAAELFGEVAPDCSLATDAFPGNVEALKKRLFPQIQPSKRNIAPDLLRDRIREKLTSPSSPDDRHAIANIVGPVALLNTSETNGDVVNEVLYVENGIVKKYQLLSMEGVSANHRVSLAAIFRSVDLLPNTSDENNPTDNLWNLMGRELLNILSQETQKSKILAAVSSLPSGMKLRFTFVDDQWHHGWYEWLKSMFPLGTAFTVCPDPQFLLNQLDVLKERDTDLRFKFDLTPPGTKADNNYANVLLLDLRLFSGNSTAEADFYKKLLPLCRKFEVAESGSLVPLEGPLVEGAFSRVKNLAWPGFCTEELKSATAWIAGGDGRTEANHRACLTLLPRLLALTDMSLPIVIFSSTGQRSLVEPFDLYSNIITTFQKPHFFSHQGGDILRSTYDKLATTFEYALAWDDLRRKCRDICRLRSDNSDDAMPAFHKQVQQKLYVELFTDETQTSKSQDFAVGGVFSVFNRIEDADLFDDVAVQNGLRYFNGGAFPPAVSPLGRYPLLKEEDDASCELERSLSDFRKTGKDIQLGFVQLRRGKIHGDSELTQHEQDSRFFWMLLSLIELFVAESLPAIAEQRAVDLRNIRLSIYAGTRMVETADTGDFTFQRNIEIHHFNDGPKLRSMAGQSIYPVVSECFRRHGIAGISVLRAIGVSLPYSGQKKEDVDRVLDRASKKVLKFGITNDLIADVDLNMPVMGKVCGFWPAKPHGHLPHRYTLCFVSVPGLDRDVACHRNSCRAFDKLHHGSLVSLNVTQNADKYNGTNVFEVDENAYGRWINGLKPKVSDVFLSGYLLDNLRPDYRALHYVADQIMRLGVAKYDLASASELPGQFDEDCELLAPVLEASRNLDSNDLAGALRSFSFANPPQRKYERPLARLLVASRIAAALQNCSGQEIALALPQKINSEGYNYKQLLAYKREAGSKTGLDGQGEKVSREIGQANVVVEQISDAMSLVWPGKTLVFRTVSRAISVGALRERLERCSSPNPPILNIAEIGEDSEFRDVHFLLGADFDSHIARTAQFLRNKGYKADVLGTE
jgi:hypothetical protein